MIEGSEESEGSNFKKFTGKGTKHVFLILSVLLHECMRSVCSLVLPRPHLELTCEESGRLQSEELRLEQSQSIRRLKVVFAEGYDHFVVVYSIHATG